MTMRQTRVTCTIRDSLGVDARLQAYFLSDDTDTLADLYGRAFQWLQVVEAVTDGQIVAWNLIFYGDTSSFTTAPTAASRVEQTGVFNWRPSGVVARRWATPIPAFIASGLVNGKIDLSNGNVLALVNQITNTNSTFTPATEDFLSLNGGTLADAFLSYRKQRRQMSRSRQDLP